MTPAASTARTVLQVGIIPGEGIGPELTGICRELLEVLAGRLDWDLRITESGPVGLQARDAAGTDFPPETGAFVASLLDHGGAVLAGAAGGRFVYELRRQLGLDWKLNPIRPWRGLVPEDASWDVLVVRDNREGFYQGTAELREGPDGRTVRHSSLTTTAAVRTVVRQAASWAARRRGHLTVVAKESGLPEASAIWKDEGRAAAAAHGVDFRMMEIDFATYQLVKNPGDFDVIAVPNTFGDILSDLGGVLMGSRGVTHGGSFRTGSGGVFQTNHGAAFDLAGKDLANPAGQILSLAMMLRDALAQPRAADTLEQALQDVWAAGLHTTDLAPRPGRCCGTREFASAVSGRLREILA